MARLPRPMFLRPKGGVEVKERQDAQRPRVLNDLQLPTIEEAEAAVRQGEQLVAEQAKQRQGKLLSADRQMDTTRITI